MILRPSPRRRLRRASTVALGLALGVALLGTACDDGLTVRDALRRLAELDGGTDASPVCVPDGGAQVADAQVVEPPEPPYTIRSAAAGIDDVLDAALDPDGRTVYFLAQGSAGPAVFRVPAGGTDPEEIFSGEPFFEPRSLVVGSRGFSLYLADPAGGDDGRGLVWALSVSGGPPVAVTGTAGTGPTALDLQEVGGDDRLYLTGRSSDDLPALLTLPAAGGPSTTLIKGPPLVAPDGLAVVPDGPIYVADPRAGPGSTGRIFQLRPSGLAIFAPTLTLDLGEPAGIAVSLDGTRLLVSVVGDCGRAEVRVLDVGSELPAGDGGRVTLPGGNPGGLHRALDEDVFGWADRSTRQLTQGGGVLVLE